ncbi:ABC transporter permease [Pedobacter frigiditerrae]|uniref:ABC transporter permease n=1 Tax=Pedobacter frigiditerrae TaxID=2530452 RepID=A0A4R0N160_9SPHI|nr:ABC transporter permease [Pedobacter frigiditerrae]TCC93420.1 ABC transporter permease [Pedobacter frigiditerrae]
MHSLIISLQSEFYKSRKTLAFWSSILLPLLLCIAISLGFIFKYQDLIKHPPQILWFYFISPISGIMGSLLLPILVIYNTYAVTNMEYKGDTWKSLFSLPLSKLSIYTSKFLYIIFLTFLTMFLFALLIIASGHAIELIRPQLEFGDYNPNELIFKAFGKLFLSSIGIISIQFLMNIMWNDFLKPFGLGFLLTIICSIMANVGWKYAVYLPYSFPSLTVMNIMSAKKGAELIIFDQAIINSLICGAVVFIIGYFIVAKKTIK